MLSTIKKSIKAVLAEREWRQAIGVPPAAITVRAVRRVLIMPSDATSIIGAKGDEAMITAVVERLRSADPALMVGIVTATDSASAIVARMGYKPVQCRSRWQQYLPVVDAAEAFGADLFVVLGADVMDGYYSPQASLRLLVTADLISRRHCPAVILGFSLNNSPAKELKPVFDAASPQLRIKVRDPISFERFQKFTHARAELVADSAFMLAPVTDSTPVRATAEWAHVQRAAGRKVFAFNVHPMLIKHADAAQVQQLIATSVAALNAALSRWPVAVVLLSHDYRGALGDDTCLAPIHAALAESWSDRLHYPTGQLSASELKGIAGHMDAVITGRMHLAIAALGGGVPVAAFSYQDKFNGLFRHFALSESLIVSPADFSQATVGRLIDHLMAECEALTTHARNRLPEVLRLSAANLAEFVPSSPASLPH